MLEEILHPIVEVVVSGVAAVALWVLKQYRDDQRFQAESQASIAASMEKLADAGLMHAETAANSTRYLAILTRLLSEFHAAAAPNRRAILIVESCLSERKATMDVCHDLANEYDLQVIGVPTWDESYRFVPHAKVVVLDVFLPDADIEQMRSIVELLLDVPVIVYSGGKFHRDDFPTAFAIIEKPDPEELRDKISQAIKRPWRALRTAL